MSDLGFWAEQAPAISNLITQSLLNSLWQGTAIALLVWGCMRLLRGASATTRHAIWLATLVVIGTLPLVSTAIVVRGVLAEDPALPAPPALVLPAVPRVEPAETWHDDLGPLPDLDWAPAAVFPRLTSRMTWSERMGEWSAWFFQSPLPTVSTALWMLIGGLMLARIILSYRALRRIRGSFEELTPGQIERLRELAGRLGIRRRVMAYQSVVVSMPMTIGAWRPAIVLPRDLSPTLTQAEYDSVMAHELAHIKRWDYATNFLQRVVQSYLFFHPAVWLIGRRLILERELACDDWAVTTCEPRHYAGCLTRLVEVLNDSKPLAAAAGILFGKTILRRRVEMLLDHNRNATTNVSKPALVYAVGLAVMLVAVCSWLTPAIAVPLAQDPAPKAAKKKEPTPAAKSGTTTRNRVGQTAPAAPLPPEPPEAPEIADFDIPEPPEPPLPPLALLDGDLGVTAPAALANLIGIQDDKEKKPVVPENEMLTLLSDIVKRDADPTVRSEALRGIYRLRSDAAINTLIQLYDSVGDVKTKGEILGYLIRRNGDNSKAIAKLTSIAKSEQNEELRNRALRALASAPGDESVNTLIQVYDGLKDQKSKLSVIRSLGVNKSRKAADKLMEIAKNDSDPVVRQAAIRGLQGGGGGVLGSTYSGVWGPGLNGFTFDGPIELFDGKRFEFDSQKMEEMQKRIEEQMKQFQERWQKAYPKLQQRMKELEEKRKSGSEAEKKQLEQEIEQIQKELEESGLMLRGEPRIRVAPRAVRPTRPVTIL